jgi:hypothetical protein
VRYDAAQTLTAAQQQQARQNIYAAPFDALAYNGLQINGAMNISQEWIDTAVTVPNASQRYSADMWSFNSDNVNYSIQSMHMGPSFGPAPGNATNGTLPYCIRLYALTGGGYAAATSYAILQTNVEGVRSARLGWGTSTAQPVTVGFFVASTVAGTFSVSFRNGAANRTYIHNCVIPNANVFYFFSFTVPGDTTGTWNTDTSVGIRVGFCFGCGATFQTATVDAWQAANFMGSTSQTNFFAATNNYIQITGFGMWPGSVGPTAAQMPYILRSHDQELLMCKRYFQKSYDYGTIIGTASQGASQKSVVVAFSASATGANNVPGPRFETEMRATPSLRFWNAYTGGFGGAKVYNPSTGTNLDCSISSSIPSVKDFCVNISGGSGWTGGNAMEAQFHYAADARY